MHGRSAVRRDCSEPVHAVRYSCNVDEVAAAAAAESADTHSAMRLIVADVTSNSQALRKGRSPGHADHVYTYASWNPPGALRSSLFLFVFLDFIQICW